MKTIAAFFTMILLTNPAMASLSDCQKMMKQANQVCKDDVGCKKNFLEVSGAEIVTTANSVICRGEKDLINGDQNSKRSNKKRRKSSRRSRLQF